MCIIVAMDETMSAKDVNMNLAAITPGLIVSYVAQRIVPSMLYALQKLGKSEEETYATLLNIPKMSSAFSKLGIACQNHRLPPSMGPNWKRSTVILCLARQRYRIVILLHKCRPVLRRERRRFPFHVKLKRIKKISKRLLVKMVGNQGLKLLEVTLERKKLHRNIIQGNLYVCSLTQQAPSESASNCP